MIDRKRLIAAALTTALLAPAGRALACGNGPMGMGAGMMMAPAGVAVVAPAVAAAVAAPTIGATVGVLPAGYLTVVVNGANFFRAGPTWYQPFQGPTGPMYRVVPAPHGM